MCETPRVSSFRLCVPVYLYVCACKHAVSVLCMHAHNCMWMHVCTCMWTSAKASLITSAQAAVCPCVLSALLVSMCVRVCVLRAALTVVGANLRAPPQCVWEVQRSRRLWRAWTCLRWEIYRLQPGSLSFSGAKLSSSIIKTSEESFWSQQWALRQTLMQTHILYTGAHTQSHAPTCALSLLSHLEGCTFDHTHIPCVHASSYTL